MKITIIIETETISEFYQHIAVIGKTIKKKAREQKLKPMDDEFPKQIWWDDNCYGEHIVKINP